MFDAEALWRSLQRLGAPERVVVAYSGGRDSHALLLAASALRPRLAALAAIHIDHGLAATSGRWAEHCRQVAARLDVPLRMRAVTVPRHSGLGLEAAARAARYAAFAELLEAGEVLLTAHHRDDQAETFLLHALRGSGVRGLAAMPEQRPLGPGALLRPLLGHGRAELAEYLAAQGGQWVEDPSNAAADADRNYLRGDILPLLETRFHGSAGRLAAAAAQAAEAEALLEELAALDLAAARADDGLAVAPLRRLSAPRRNNLLRHWLREQGVRPPGRTRLESFQHLLSAGDDRSPELAWDGLVLRRYRERICLTRALPAPQPERVLAWDLRAPLALPLGRLEAELAERGLRRDLLGRADVEVRFRQGGERCRVAGSRGSRPLKKCLQELALPPWERPFLPLLYVGGELAAAGDALFCEGFAADPGEPALRLVWRRQFC